MKTLTVVSSCLIDMKTVKKRKKREAWAHSEKMDWKS